MAGGHGEGFVFRVDGLGGHIDVFQDRIELHRHGFLNFFFEVLKLYEGSTDTVLPIEHITSCTIVQTIFVPSYIRFSYSGAPAYSPHYWVDAMQPNAVLMGYVDNRGFHRLKRFLDAARQAMLTGRGAAAGDGAADDHGHAGPGHGSAGQGAAARGSGHH